MSIVYSSFHGLLPSGVIAEVASLSDQVFESPGIDYAWRLTNMPEVSLFCARRAGELVGFKAGYATTQSGYYSWLGAVHPKCRNQGIAGYLTKAQHEWLHARGYSTVETSSRSENSIMARVNFKSGFVVVGTKLESHGLQVLWSKKLG